jgi:hypothetical protein
MITFMVLDTEYQDYQTFDSEQEARDFIRTEIECGAGRATFRLFRRQELEIEE